MTGDDIRSKNKKFIMPSTINYYAEPIVVDRAEGVWVVDADGRSYLDLFGGILTVSLAHAQPDVVSAIQVQATRLTHISTLYPTAPVVDLAESLAGIAPGDISQSFFVASGTEADEMAVMLAYAHTGRSELIALRNGYSGRSMLAQTLTAHSNWRNLPTQVAGVKHAMEPYCYRCPLKLSYPGCGIACATDIEKLIQYTTTGQIAGFLAEPVQGVGGFVVPPKEYFQVAVEIVRRYAGLFISDEVQTGFGRQGDAMWGFQLHGVVPDIVCMGKPIGNGHPLGAVVTRPEIVQAMIDEGVFFSTFGGNNVSCAAGMAVLDVLEREGLQENARQVGNHFRAGLRRLAERHALIGDVRGSGLLVGVELVHDRRSLAPATAETRRVVNTMRDFGVLTATEGPHGNVLKLRPPICFTREQADITVDALDRALAAL